MPFLPSAQTENQALFRGTDTPVPSQLTRSTKSQHSLCRSQNLLASIHSFYLSGLGKTLSAEASQHTPGWLVLLQNMVLTFHSKYQ